MMQSDTIIKGTIKLQELSGLGDKAPAGYDISEG